MELIIIPMLTTIALIAMQAMEFIGTRGSREWATQLQAGDELTDTAVLQILDHFHAVGQLRLQGRQRLARKRRAGLGRVPLPGQGIGNVQARQGQQGLGLGRPLGCDDLLAFGPANFVELFAQGLGSTLVACAQVLEDFLQLLHRRVACQPLADARGPLARGLSWRRPALCYDPLCWTGPGLDLYVQFTLFTSLRCMPCRPAEQIWL